MFDTFRIVCLTKRVSSKRLPILHGTMFFAQTLNFYLLKATYNMFKIEDNQAVPAIEEKATNEKTTATERVDYKLLQDDLKGMLASMDSSGEAVPDTCLDARLRQGLVQAAKELGYTEYDPNTACTYKRIAYEDRDFLAGLSLRSNGKDAVIAWGDHVIVLDPEISMIDRKPFFFVPGNEDFSYGLSLLPRTLNFPISVSFDRDKLGKNHANTLISLETAGDFLPLLRVDGETASLAKIDGDFSFTILSKTSFERKDGKGLSVVLDVADCDHQRIWAPGEAEFWLSASYPMKAEKKGKVLTVIGLKGEVAEINIGQSVEKLHSLSEGSYSVVDYRFYDTEWGQKSSITLVINGKHREFSTACRGYLIESRLKTLPVISKECPAELIITGIKVEQKDRDGKPTEVRSAIVKFILDSDKNNPLLAAMMKKRNQEADNEIPF